jgi:uncharacterized protein (DUF2126 family)
MTRRLVLMHRLDSRFDQPVRTSTHWLRLRPAPNTRARVEAYSLRVAPGAHFINWLRDPYENHLARLDLPRPVAQLTLTVELLLGLAPVDPFDFLVDTYAARVPFEYPAQLRKELAPYLAMGPGGTRLAAWIAGLDRQPRYVVDFLDRLNRAAQARVGLDGAVRPAAVDVEQLLTRGRGTAWELAWLLTLGLRGAGLAARFVSGYRIATGPADAAAGLHAWSEAFLPGAGWIGLDPGAALFTDEHYVPLATAPDPLRALPWVGYREACVEQFTETVTAGVLSPAAAPAADTAWSDITALGHRIEHALRAEDVKLAVGHSLSFVSATDPTAAEWTTAALGPGKRRAAEALLTALCARLAPGAALHLGQGEWYAGEDRPRWRLSGGFREDRVPVWRDPARLAMTARPAGTTPADARRFATQLAGALGLPAGLLIPAYEDGLHQQWREGRRPAPDPQELRDPARRRRLAERLSEIGGEPVGYVLPLRWDVVQGGWRSGSWALRRAGLHLLPGDSALGLRLPLDGLAPEPDAELPFAERCPFEPRSALPEQSAGPAGVAARSGEESAPAAGAPRTAVCVERRAGALYVFLPPLSHLEHYLALVAAVEAAAESSGEAVWLEGYEPPSDPRLRRFVLEPDAGVLRLQLPDAPSWSEQVALLEAAYAEAARLGLVARRRLGDGTHQPTGGGAALILGGTRPADSPLLQRPALLRSLLACWQRHPSLSYFFATRAVGPSGRAPRPDEGRPEALYELGLALERLGPAAHTPPWFADRVLRHLLADPAGDLRRAEWCMERLYDPARASRRLGELTLRAFETAADARLAALQALLVMALVVRFVRAPDDRGLVPWGAALHDRYLLPQPLWQDLGAVLRDLAAVDLPLQRDWFAPFLELHFPVLGTARIGEIAIELRLAHEPWPLLAEEVTGAGVVRFVDSANERLQVRATGVAPGRYLLACNGRRVPLQPGEAYDEFVAGVRYKSANPPATRHPTTPPLTALVFDLIDAWNGRVVGGFSYALAPRAGLTGAAALAPVPGAQAGGGSQPGQRTAAPWFVPQRGAAGRILAHGARGPVAPPPTENGAGYVLDLTRQP